MELNLFNIVLTCLLAILTYQLYTIYFNPKKSNFSTIINDFGIKEKIALEQEKEYMTVPSSNNIEDKPITKPYDVVPFTLDTKSNTFNNYYDVQPGLYDNQLVPIKYIPKEIGETVQENINNQINNEKTISEVYDNLILPEYKKITKEPLDNSNRSVPAYKGYSLDLNNWNLYKDDNFVNGGAYNNLIGMDTSLENQLRVVDNYNDFEIKEFK